MFNYTNIEPVIDDFAFDVTDFMVPRTFSTLLRNNPHISVLMNSLYGYNRTYNSPEDCLHLIRDHSHDPIYDLHRDSELLQRLEENGISEYRLMLGMFKSIHKGGYDPRIYIRFRHSQDALLFKLAIFGTGDF